VWKKRTEANCGSGRGIVYIEVDVNCGNMSIVQRQKVTTHIFQNLQESTKTKCLVSRNHTIHKFGVYLYEIFFLITTTGKMYG